MTSGRAIRALLWRLLPRPLRAPSALRLRLTLWCLLVCALALTLLGFLLLEQERVILLSGLDRQLTATAVGALSPLRSSAHGSHPGGSVECPMTRFQAVGSGGETMTSFVCVSAPGGQGRLRPPNMGALLSPSFGRAGSVPAALLGKPSQLSTCSGGDGWRVCTLRLYGANGRLIGATTAGAPLDVIGPPLDEMRAWLLIVFPIALVLITAGGWLLIGRALAPIDRITQTAGAIGAGNLSGRLGLPRSDDEVGRLAATFDGMLDRLEDAFKQQRAFAAAASHELRTPLTIVKSDLDILRRSRPIPPDEAEVLAGVDEEIARMGRMVEDLLTLARADSGQDELLRELVSFDALIQTAIAGMSRLAQEKGLTLESHLTPTVELVGDASRLRQMVLNLLSNAVTYTPAGGSIQVHLAKEGEQARLAVADTGIGIAREDIPHIFESFYRADKARSRTAGGAGLGLALVQWCVRAHRGRIGVESAPGEGSTFTVSLPLALIDEDYILTSAESLPFDAPTRPTSV